MLIQAGLDLEFDLTDPTVMMTVREELMNFNPDMKLNDDDAMYGAQMMSLS
jgi:hypothetical protein